MNPIKILYVYGGVMSQGGIEAFMMNNFRHFTANKIHIDFVVHGFEKGVYDDEIISAGSKIFHVPIKSKNLIGNRNALKKIFKDNDYSIVHSHMDAMNSLVLRIAKDCDVPIRISHSHNTNHLTKNKLKYKINELAKRNIKKVATHLMACSENAGRWLYGDKLVDSGKVMIVPNAINIEDYKFNAFNKVKISKEFNLNNEFIIGHVGRFDYQKNHDFLLDIFKEFLSLEPNSKLILVGDGHLNKDIRLKINSLKLNENVIITGNRKDIPELLSAMDLFLFPSFFEGLGIVLIEAQASGLECLVSSTIPKEVKITNLVHFENLKKDAHIWAEKCMQIKKNKKNRPDTVKELDEAGYNIQSASEKIQNYYFKLIKEL